ncbi:hypothetical protein BH10CYA1_BH10CYA1_34950 [soil metagenome]
MNPTTQLKKKASYSRPMSSRGQWKWIPTLSFLILSVFAGVSSYAASWQPSEGQELVGTAAPEFEGLEWINSAPFTLHGLQGKVVLIRFWLADCPLCENSAAALNYLNEKYETAGLVVIGIHHAKSEATKKTSVVEKSAKRLGFKFPIAQDTDWKTIDAFWLGKTKRKYTSATFLIDKAGLICWLHDGGTLSMSGDGNAAFVRLKGKIESLLSTRQTLLK